MAYKYALENGLSAIVLERGAGLGGVWNFSDDSELATVMDSTITSSSASVTEAADFPMDHRLGNFIHGKDVLRYLEEYAQHFNLVDHIRFNKYVSNIHQASGNWTIHCEDESYASKYLVVCSGVNQQKRVNISELQGFSGPIKHATEIKSLYPIVMAATIICLCMVVGKAPAT